MSDTMRMLPYEQILERIFEEYRTCQSLCEIPVQSWYRKTDSKTYRIFGEVCETPIGPAAGPHTQLALNILASYLTGSRFIELKTVQILDSLEIDKPCIDVADEGYNTEWSTELSLKEAWEEYAKAWILLHLVECLFDLKVTDTSRSFIFNMSVGYDLEGIQSEAMQRYIGRMKDSSEEPSFDGWIAETIRRVPDLIAGTDLEIKSESLSEAMRCVAPEMCKSVTLSTMHGCPPNEIESICAYMLGDKSFDTYVKLNPTLLGYDTVRKTLDSAGFGYVKLNRDGFEHDLQYEDALTLLESLRTCANDHGRGFGIKLSNTLATANEADTLPGDEMYLSGRALYPLTIELARRLSAHFDGNMPVSYSGGISVHNAADVLKTGILPVTLATDLLKPGGYLRQVQIAEAMAAVTDRNSTGIDNKALEKLAQSTPSKPFYQKQFKGDDEVLIHGDLPVFDCYRAPCVEACAIHQHIPEYIRLVGEKRYAEALQVIYERNALPSITGEICDHQCQLVCTRLDYEGCVNIREIKKLAVEHGMSDYAPSHKRSGSKVSVAIIGAGPAGLSAAYFLAREGIRVTVFERESDAGGVVRNIVPHFRISRETIERDVEHIKSLGVEFKFGAREGLDVASLRDKGFSYIVVAVGTYQPRMLPLQSAHDNVFAAFPFLSRFNRCPDELHMGKSVVVIGAGDTAMDCARAALRCKGVQKVTIVYRRSKIQMPASREEYEDAVADGVEFLWLRSPESYTNDGRLNLRIMELGEPGDDGRRRPVPTDNTVTMGADSIISAVGDDPDGQALESIGLTVDADGYVSTDDTGETHIENVFVIGDSRTGTSTIVHCISEGRMAADAICRKVEPGWSRDEALPKADATKRFDQIAGKRGAITLKPNPRAEYDRAAFGETEFSRCLECNYICNKCVDVCPNRANIAVAVGADTKDRNGAIDGEAILFADPYEIVHIDAYCNECGNCATFCPWEGKPYIDKPTVFTTREDFAASANPGWMVSGDEIIYRFSGSAYSCSVTEFINPAYHLPAHDSDDAGTTRFIALFRALYESRPHLFLSVEDRAL